MKTIEYNNECDIHVHFDRIKPFKNICKVTGKEEFCNIIIDYVPSDKLIDIVDYRKYFNKCFNSLIEDIAVEVFNEIKNSVQPKKLRVQVFLEGNESLTDWNVTVEE